MTDFELFLLEQKMRQMDRLANFTKVALISLISASSVVSVFGIASGIYKYSNQQAIASIPPAKADSKIFLRPE